MYYLLLQHVYNITLKVHTVAKWYTQNILFTNMGFLKYFSIPGKPIRSIGDMHESTLTFSEFNFPKRWSIVKVSVKSLLFKHFVKVVCTLFVVSVVVDTASLSAGIGTDTENKRNIILGNVLSKTRNYHTFLNRLHNHKLASTNLSLRKSRNQF